MSISARDAAFECAQVIADHNGGNTVVLDLGGKAAWTDFFVIATATSTAHMRGLLRHVDEALGVQGYAPTRRPQPADDEEWCLVDFGDFVVHIMSQNARTFYELESLWFEASVTAVEPQKSPPKAVGQA
ncbi:MAG: ribosome silencing factor [Spirochaetales bacterium]|nr:ribosome silencing factor [Spirochaetales bacterium]